MPKARSAPQTFFFFINRQNRCSDASHPSSMELGWAALPFFLAHLFWPIRGPSAGYGGRPQCKATRPQAAESPRRKSVQVLADWLARAVEWLAAGGGVEQERERLRASSRTNIRCNDDTAVPTYLMDRFLSQLSYVCACEPGLFSRATRCACARTPQLGSGTPRCSSVVNDFWFLVW